MACLVYYRRDVCQYHWERHCDDGAGFDLKVEFGIGAKPAAKAYLARKKERARRKRVAMLLAYRRGD